MTEGDTRYAYRAHRNELGYTIQKRLIDARNPRATHEQIATAQTGARMALDTMRTVLEMHSPQRPRQTPGKASQQVSGKPIEDQGRMARSEAAPHIPSPQQESKPEETYVFNPTDRSIHRGKFSRELTPNQSLVFSYLLERGETVNRKDLLVLLQHGLTRRQLDRAIVGLRTKLTTSGLFDISRANYRQFLTLKTGQITQRD